MVAAVAMLVVILGLGLVQGQISLPGIGQAVQAMSERVQNGISSAEWLVGTEQTEAATGATEATETLNLIPIEQIPAGDITKLEDAAQSETQQGTQSSAQQEEQADGQQGTQDSTQQEAQDDGQQSAQADAANEAQDDAQATVASEPTTYIVQRGDTLTGISLKLYGTNRKAAAIAELNELENSDDIREGQKLLLP
jgi:nucleoid-associated protein YgaU